ncbi:MAG: nickel/cobalt efflux protein RcnA [Alphaproteobacteria bacterium]
MTPFSELLQQGTAHAWLFAPSAILLGALHGLEPGHSKTMMAAFIVAVRGTVGQAILLGLAATASHTAIVWLVALLGMYFGNQWTAEASEPYLQLASSVLIIGVAIWMLWRTWRDQQQEKKPNGHHHHHDEVHKIETSKGLAYLSVFEDHVPPRFRLRFTGHNSSWPVAEKLMVETLRSDGKREVFSFVSHGDYLESEEIIPEPHEFLATLRLVHGDHIHEYFSSFHESGHMHDHSHAPEFEDAHQKAHANDIQQRFTGRSVTTGQIILFGLTGGLIPCPAAITVLLLCLQLKQITLGVALVLCFSIGLALTMVASGVLAALSVKHISKRWSGFGKLARRAPYFSSALIISIGFYVGYQGWLGLHL